jgi:hypothetical protein
MNNINVDSDVININTYIPTSNSQVEETKYLINIYLFI